MLTQDSWDKRKKIFKRGLHLALGNTCIYFLVGSLGALIISSPIIGESVEYSSLWRLCSSNFKNSELSSLAEKGKVAAGLKRSCVQDMRGRAQWLLLFVALSFSVYFGFRPLVIAIKNEDMHAFYYAPRSSLNAIQLALSLSIIFGFTSFLVVGLASNSLLDAAICYEGAQLRARVAALKEFHRVFENPEVMSVLPKIYLQNSLDLVRQIDRFSSFDDDWEVKLDQALDERVADCGQHAFNKGAPITIAILCLLMLACVERIKKEDDH